MCALKRSSTRAGLKQALGLKPIYRIANSTGGVRVRGYRSRFSLRRSSRSAMLGSIRLSNFCWTTPREAIHTGSGRIIQLSAIFLRADAATTGRGPTRCPTIGASATSSLLSGSRRRGPGGVPSRRSPSAPYIWAGHIRGCRNHAAACSLLVRIHEWSVVI